jgi:membrane protease YdiL (CAAX protease family)
MVSGQLLEVMGIGKAVLLTLLFLIFELALQLISYSIFDPWTYIENEHIRGLTIIIARVTAYLILFYFFWKPKSEILSFRLEKLNIPVIVLLFLIILGTEFLNRPFADLDRLFDATRVNYFYEGYSTLQVYGTITALLVAPVFEELFFRKFLFQKLLLKNGFLTVILVSSFLFSIIHWETPLNLIPAFIFGLISAFIFYRTGNIIYCILLHLLYNACSQLIYYKAKLYSEWLNWLNFGIIYWTLFAFGILIILFALQKIPNTRSLDLPKNDN